MLTGQTVERLPQLPPDTLFAVRWQTRTSSSPVFFGRTTAPARAAIAEQMADLPADGSKWQEILGHSMITEDKAGTEPSADPKTSDTADLHILTNVRSSIDANADNKSIPSATRLQHAEESSAAAETPAPSPVVAAEFKDDLVNNIFPLLYRAVVKIILLICYLTVWGYLLDWAWSITLLCLQTKFTFEGDFEAHTTFNKTQAEIQFVYQALYGVLTGVYFMMWW